MDSRRNVKRRSKLFQANAYIWHPPWSFCISIDHEIQKRECIVEMHSRFATICQFRASTWIFRMMRRKRRTERTAAVASVIQKACQTPAAPIA